ncbi:DUF3373 domain-containing protein [Geobacter sp. FeAm09]|uniref:DUF3373 domain-containing protein n=1 Tax=Geobacter sp. FeAm09 TaxID=2597769 RepID=UPI0011ECAB9E|nr:DUF3373 domain-containing protein [Geobacter sp. FeAm09]QEM70268.1 DUF3373 domain-containing protein [Geobacter sp. FeAm09]
MLSMLLAGLVAGMSLPLPAQAADEELLQKVDKLYKEIETLKGSVKKVEDKSIGRWLTIGGDYRFRYDYLSGRTKPFTDVTATFSNAQSQMQQGYFNAVAAGDAAATQQWAGAIAGMTSFSQAMANVKTYNQALAFLGANQAMLQGLGNYAVTVPSYKPENATLYTNRLGLDLHVKATKDVTVTTRLVMYKVFGSQDDQAVTNGNSAPYFADRVGVFDGTLGHVPSSSYLDVDRAYATWSNIADQPLWFSVGRRPSTNGAPSNLRLNNERPGNGGTPSLLVDYAFDGMTIGYAPDIEMLPGAYAKVCYGRGFESGFRSTPSNSIADTDMLGIAVIPVDTDPLRVWLQWNRGFNIFDAPTMSNTYFGSTAPKTNLGDIDWWGAGAMSTLKKVGPGDLNFFTDAALSVTHPNSNVSAQFGFQGLMSGGFFNPEAPTSKTGWAVSAGVRYDLPSKTKLGFEYNHGSKDWITFAPAADDMWTSKVGTRGNVYEGYVIQELNLKPVSSYFSKTFFRVGYQYYDFEYTGSNNWVGAPVKISEVKGQMMTTTPLEYAHNVYATFEVHF